MPLIEKSSYKTPFGLKNPHLLTIFPQVFRRVKGVNYNRERLDTPDNDFLDLDWCANGNSRCVILVHGLEGHSYRSYMLGMVKTFSNRGWDTVSMNLRGCSGETNRKLRFYHHGDTGDLDTVIRHTINKGYETIAVIGFSLGANQILKYLGEKQDSVPQELICSVAISSPCELFSCAVKMDSGSSEFYRMRFLKMLLKKMQQKKKLFENEVNLDGYRKIRTFKEFDNRYTAPFHGFRDAEDYYRKSGCLQYLEAVRLPVLMIIAADDPFLTEQCFPFDIARRSSSIYLEVTPSGGHMGFVSFNRNGEYWHESRAFQFVSEIAG
jgi:predicted alpha/beta-fold hydrolase